MKSSNQTSKSHQPALSMSGVDKEVPEVDRTRQDAAIYLRRGHKARSEAFHKGLKYVGIMMLALLKRLAGAGDAIQAWLFTPFYSGGRKS